MSKILLAYDNGQIATYKGKTLDEIPVEGDILDIAEADDDCDMVEPSNDEADSTSCLRERATVSSQVIDSVSETEQPCHVETGHEIRTGKLHVAVYCQCLKCFCSMNVVLWRKSYLLVFVNIEILEICPH